jgi:hypothetical protein
MSTLCKKNNTIQNLLGRLHGPACIIICLQLVITAAAHGPKVEIHEQFIEHKNMQKK